MFPTVHDWRGDDLNTQGYGALADCVSAEVSEELNGAFTLELKYPLNGLHHEYLIPQNIIMIKPNHNQGLQAFRINEVKKSFSNNIMVYANHICYDLSGYGIRAPRNYNSLAEVITAMDTMDWSASSNSVYHDFSFGTDMTSSRPFVIDGIQTLRSWMGGQEGSIIDVYGGEWIYDNFSCFLTARRGIDTNYRISYGKNLAEYEKERENALYSHVVAYWKKSDVTVFSDFVPTDVYCTFRVAYTDVSQDYEDQPTAIQLNQSATDYIAKMQMNPQTITITPAQIGNDIIGLGDSVLICYEDVFQTRVIKTVWDALGGFYKSLELGTKKTNIADTIKSLTTSTIIESSSAPTPLDYVTDYGTSGDWTYRKWNSGLMECWFRKTYTSVACTTAWRQVYYGTLLSGTGVDYPQGGFSQYPEVNMTLQVNAGSGWIAPNYDNYSTKHTGGAWIYSPASGTYNTTLNIYAKGYM